MANLNLSELMLFPECNKPEDPPEVAIFDCLYEFVCILDCSARGMTQNDSTLNDINGFIGSLSVGPWNSLGSNVAKHGAFTTGAPETHPWLMGLVTRKHWKTMVIDNNRERVNTSVGGPGWVHTPHHNGLSNTNRWKVAKYYYLERHYKFKHDPKTGIPMEPFACPTFTDFQPDAPGLGWWEQFVTCPKYYELKSCTSCTGEKSNIPDIYVESADEIAGPIVNARPMGKKTGGIFDCYDVKDMGPGAGVRTDEDLITVNVNPPFTNPATGKTATSTRYAPLTIENLTGGEGVEYENHGNCQGCRLPYLLAFSVVDSCENEACDSLLVSQLNVMQPWNATMQLWSDSAKMRIHGADRNASNAAFLSQHGPVFYYWVHTAPNTPGKCWKVTVIDSAVMGFDGSCIHKDIVDVALQNSLQDLSSSIPAAQIYSSFCSCEGGGGYIGDPNNKTVPWMMCHPLNALLTLVKGPSNQDVDEGEDAEFTTTVIAPSAFYTWRLKDPAGKNTFSLRDGQSWTAVDSDGVRRTISVTITKHQILGLRYSTVILKNMSTKYNNYSVDCVVSNGLGKTIVTPEALLTVNDVPIKILPDPTNVTLIKISSWCISLVQRQGLGGGGAAFFQATKSGQTITNEYRWVVGDYQNAKGKYYRVPLRGPNMRRSCWSPSWKCDHSGGIEYTSSSLGCSRYFDSHYFNGAQVALMGVKVEEIVMYGSWKQVKRRYPFVGGKTLSSGQNETNRWQIAFLDGPYSNWNDIPIKA
jgi:hypothetical protein